MPYNKTSETFHEIQEPTKLLPASVPSPELYIIVHGKPTKAGVVWCNLVDVNHVKAAIHKLHQINWLYGDVHEDTVDFATKQVIEVANNATSRILQKASKDDINEFQAYTIRNLDNRLSTSSDIYQYKLLSVKGEPIDNRVKYLDVMCFPVLFPSGEFGEHHPRGVKLSPSEYIKSRLLNKDARFRKDPHYVFYLLWLKELREISAGIYNVLTMLGC